MDKLNEAATASAKKFAVVFDFDLDSCYPSPAVSSTGEPNEGHNVTYVDTNLAHGCREPAQLDNSNTYHRRAVITKPDVQYAVHMYALYFMKDKDAVVNVFGHRHDWEFALVWTTFARGKEGPVLTHASYSEHREVECKDKGELAFDAAAPNAPNAVKIIYHKTGSTHAMQLGRQDEEPENHKGRWITPTIVDWYRMEGNGVSNQQLRDKLNEPIFGAADCSVNDANFVKWISKNPPPDYPSGADWKAVPLTEPEDRSPWTDVTKRGGTQLKGGETHVTRRIIRKVPIDRGKDKREKVDS